MNKEERLKWKYYMDSSAANYKYGHKADAFDKTCDMKATITRWSIP
jgi:hypothetical protein